MAAPGRVGSRSAQHEERAGSLESVPTACPASLERPAEPGKAAEQPGRTLWERICEEYEVELPPFPEGYKTQQEAVLTVSPMEESLFRGFSAEHSFPFPHWATDSHIPCTQIKLETIDPKTCSPKEYLETFIFPVLLPGIASLLHQAKKEKCFERKRTKFIACDFLTEWLYNQNPKRTGEPFTDFFSIPFVEQWLKQHPRPPIPLSLLLTEEEAALSIQSFWRAYLVRCDPEIQELRQWQKKLREDKHIRERVRLFWAKQEQKVKQTMEEEEEAKEEEAAVTPTSAP
ncbi:IQ domain-containing protein K [Eptesicus fuscus]|uniref:IQ domain-containing protein K n=1 Tax=Eptesicus fuscus TaxID=29078 RepID=UPI002404749F|nr:IQ domain-containing protein K [Eptesicus fuscus]